VLNGDKVIFIFSVNETLHFVKYMEVHIVVSSLLLSCVVMNSLFPVLETELCTASDVPMNVLPQVYVSCVRSSLLYA
jgi:hypothetical protein